MKQMSVYMLSLLACISALLFSSSAYPPPPLSPWKVAEWEEDAELLVEKTRDQPSSLMKEAGSFEGYYSHHPQAHASSHAKPTRYFNQEVLYRLNILPCRVKIPPPGYVYHYVTLIVFNYWRRPHRYRCFPIMVDKCMIKNWKENKKIIFELESPGYSSNRYPSRRLSLYHVKCNSSVNIRKNDFQLQPKIRVSSNKKECVDYVNITSASGESIKEVWCGDTTEDYSSVDGNTLVTFRSSRYNNYKGFRLHAVCMNNTTIQDNPQAGCISVDNYMIKLGYREDSNEFINVDDLLLYIKEKLLYFHHYYAFQGGYSKVMSVGEANRHRNVLTMAVLSEHSCDPVMRVIGKEVTKLFPSPVLLEETVRVLADDSIMEV